MAAEQSPLPERPRFRSYSQQEDLNKALLELEQAIISIRRMSFYIILSAITALASIIYSLGVRARLSLHGNTFDFHPELILLIGFPLTGLILLFLWERQVALGTTLYEEISDEVEWRHRTYRQKTSPQQVNETNLASDETTEGEPTGFGRPNIEVRLLLRRFLLGSTLPFVIARSAANTVYAVFFIICIVLNAVIISWPIK